MPTATYERVPAASDKQPAAVDEPMWLENRSDEHLVPFGLSYAETSDLLRDRNATWVLTTEGRYDAELQRWVDPNGDPIPLPRMDTTITCYNDTTYYTPTAEDGIIWQDINQDNQVSNDD